MAIGPTAANAAESYVNTLNKGKLSGMSVTNPAYNSTGGDKNMVSIMEHIGPNFGLAILERAMNPVKNKYDPLSQAETYKPATRFPLAETIRSQVDTDPLYSLGGSKKEPENGHKTQDNASESVDSKNPENNKDKTYHPYTQYGVKNNIEKEPQKIYLADIKDQKKSKNSIYFVEPADGVATRVEEELKDYSSKFPDVSDNVEIAYSDVVTDAQNVNGYDGAVKGYDTVQSRATVHGNAVKTIYERRVNRLNLEAQLSPESKISEDDLEAKLQTA